MIVSPVVNTAPKPTPEPQPKVEPDPVKEPTPAPQPVAAPDPAPAPVETQPETGVAATTGALVGDVDDALRSNRHAHRLDPPEEMGCLRSLGTPPAVMRSTKI